MIVDSDSFMPAVEGSRTSIKTDHDHLRGSRHDTINNLSGSSPIIVDNGQNKPKIALMQSLQVDDRKRTGQIFVADAQIAVENDQDFYSSQSYHPLATKKIAGRSRFRHLDRQVVEDSLADLDRLFQQVEIRPVQTHGHPAGLRVVSIEPGSIFDQLGLRSTDVIVGVNGAAITTPDEADLLFQSVKAGGDVTIQVKGKRRNRIIHLDIS